jgi:raffinose/stachyose/melibiose transport system substrate-binding protein
MTTGEWDTVLAQESLGIPMASNAQWPRQLAEAKSVVDATTKWLPWAVYFEDKSEINAKIKANFGKLI